MLYINIGLILFLFASSCDAPRQSRTLSDLDNSNSIPDYQRDDQDQGGGEDQVNPGEVNRYPDAAHCQWAEENNPSFAYNHQSLGRYNLCQGRNNRNVLYIQLESDLQGHIHFFPVPINDRGRPDFFHDSRKDWNKWAGHLPLPGESGVLSGGTIYPIRFSSNAPTEGVVMMKRQVHDYGTFGELENAYAFSHCIETEGRLCEEFSRVGGHIVHSF